MTSTMNTCPKCKLSLHIFRDNHVPENCFVNYRIDDILSEFSSFGSFKQHTVYNLCMNQHTDVILNFANNPNVSVSIKTERLNVDGEGTFYIHDYYIVTDKNDNLLFKSDYILEVCNFIKK